MFKKSNGWTEVSIMLQAVDYIYVHFQRIGKVLPVVYLPHFPVQEQRHLFYQVGLYGQNIG